MNVGNRAWHEVVATGSSLLMQQHELHTKEHPGPSFGNLCTQYVISHTVCNFTHRV